MGYVEREKIYSEPLRFGWICLLAGLVASGGCKFREADPSPDIYLAGVAPGQSTVGQKESIQAGGVVPSKFIAMVAAAAPAAEGFKVQTEKSALYFRPPAEMVRFLATGGMRAYLDGTCTTAVSVVRFPCTPSQQELTRAELTAAKVLYGRDIERIAKRVEGKRVVFGEVDGPEVLVSASERGVTAIRYKKQALFTDILAATEPLPLEAEEWEGLLDVPASGTSEAVRTAMMNAICVPHAGGISGIGPAVRNARDLASEQSLSVLDAAGVLIRQNPVQAQVCVVVTKNGRDTVMLASQRAWRTWHRGDYAGLSARQVQGRLEAQKQGHETARDCVITLYQDPSSTKLQDLVSHIDCGLVP
jgi:hypothetical protein